MDPLVKTTFRGLLLGTFLVSVDQTVVDTILPVIVKELGDTWLYAWVSVSYTLGTAVALPIAGRLADIRPPIKMYCMALCAFAATSALCGFAESMPQLVFMRAIQGLAGGGMLAIGSALLGHMFPPAERARYFGIFGAVIGAAGLVAPLLGGLLADYVSWRVAFFINIPTATLILYIFLAHTTIKPEISAEPFDFGGASTLMVGTTSLMLALAVVGRTRDWTSPWVLGGAILSVVTLLLFIRIERKRETPLLDLKLFRNKALTWSCLAQWGNAGVLVGYVLFLPLFMIHVRGYSATAAGLTLLSSTSCAIVSAVLLQRLIDRFGYKKLLLIASFSSAAILAVGWRYFREEIPLWAIIIFLCALGFTFGLIMPIFSLVAQSAVEKKNLGTATSLVQFARELGFANATAILGTVMIFTLHADVPNLLPPDLARGLGVVQFQDQEQLENKLKGRLQQLVKLSKDESEAGRKKLLADPLLTQTIRRRLQNNQTVKAELKTLESHYKKEIKTVLDEALTRATAATFLGGAFFALLCFLCCLKIPEIELKKE